MSLLHEHTLVIVLACTKLYIILIERHAVCAVNARGLSTVSSGLTLVFKVGGNQQSMVAIEQ